MAQTAVSSREMHCPECGASTGHPLEEVVADIKERGAEQYISENSTNDQRTLDKDLIRYNYNLSIRDARMVKKVVVRETAVLEGDGQE